jgi:hypothetical protein
MPDQQALDRYIKNGGVSCPVCKSNNIEGEPISVMQGGVAEQDCHCTTCGAAWCDIYTLTDIEMIEEPVPEDEEEEED